MADRSVVVCCGSGGVGKTTVSATFALAAARAGRRACVVTVDPARRLADALGVESLPNQPTEVEGNWPGHLHALMLDSKGTFDDLVGRYARTPEQAESILANRLYQNLAGALSGTQEYMAMEKLYELVQSDEFDIVVVDTPPTRNALDLLDAPRRLTRFLENRLFRALLVPTRMSLRAVSVATQALLRTISKVAGAEIVQDAVGFFQAFEGMEDGFRTRASAVHELLIDPATAYVLVTSARPTPWPKQASSPRNWPSASGGWLPSSSTDWPRRSGTVRARVPVTRARRRTVTPQRRARRWMRSRPTWPR